MPPNRTTVTTDTAAFPPQAAAGDDIREELRLPSAPRIQNALLGGRDNTDEDRRLVAAITTAAPFASQAARQARAFVETAVRHLAERGISQFLDIGCGLPSPTGANTHDVAQQVLPRARVVYVDTSLQAVVHARALLRCAPPGVTAACRADLTQPDRLLAAPEVTAIIDLSRPVAVLLGSVLHLLPDSRHGPVHGPPRPHQERPARRLGHGHRAPHRRLPFPRDVRHGTCVQRLRHPRPDA
ncbi:SAM-dependent methyltransferase [Streptomyces aidingensis]|uniref:S-adenosyl methyltransferase n=1 Tax=Streptomyces aidingensis TaxID=910347 RepID=A0A1I1KG46_9ACTN|nr:SAM-dependent methyltransferase [Streptomyces aidingensis]SFC57073.1 S-adenosyl methyltransferase [Streptomyces aidingensis]